MKNPFKASDPASPDAAVRRDEHALPADRDSDDPVADERLERTAREDDDVSVRRAAVGALTAPARLLALYEDANCRDALGDAIRARLAERFDVAAVDDDIAQRLLASDAAVLAPLIAARAAGESLRLRALAAVEDDASLVRVVEDSRFHDTRLAAAERLDDESALRQALVAARSRDKVVARQLQQRLDQRTRVQTRQAEALRDRDATLAAIEQLASSVWSPQHDGRRQVLHDRWAALDVDVRAGCDARFAAAGTRLDAVIATHAATVEPSASDTASNDAPAATAVATVDAPSGSVGHVPDASTEDGPDAAPVAPRVELDAASRAWVESLRDVPLEGLAAAASTASPDGELGRSLAAHVAAVAVLFDPPFALAGSRPAAVQQRRSRIDALLDLERVLPGVAGEELPWVAPLAEHRDALAQRLAQSRQESADRLKATVRQFGMLSGMVKEGKWAPASSLFRRIEKKVGAMEDAERRELHDRLERARGQLAEMSDWQDFAAKPKLEEVVMRMEALATAELAPPARAKQVRQLQAEWKSLGASRASNELWPRFKTAADTAYEPSKAWFEERGKERDAKRAERIAIVEELEAAAGEASPAQDGTPADARALQSRVSRARQAWSRTRVQDRKPDKALETRFTAALKPFEGVLQDEYLRNEAEKQELIERMTALATSDIDQHAANRAKSLQAAWKVVGVTRRKQDQALWETFNEQAKIVFGARRTAAREQQKSELAHVYRGREIVDQLKKLGKHLPVDESGIQSLASEFDALPDFPERDRKGLIRAYREALDGVSRQREAGQKRRAQASRDEVQRLVGLCERIERAVEAAADGVDSGENPLTLRDDVLDVWSNGGGDVSVARDVAVQLEQRRDAGLAHLAAGSAPDWKEAEEARRDLLIRMEVTADVETPSEDRSRRMRFQLENLQQGMTGGGVTDRRARLAELEQRWLATPPARSSVSGSLESRFLKAMGR